MHKIGSQGHCSMSRVSMAAVLRSARLGLFVRVGNMEYSLEITFCLKFEQTFQTYVYNALCVYSPLQWGGTSVMCSFSDTWNVNPRFTQGTLEDTTSISKQQVDLYLLNVCNTPTHRVFLQRVWETGIWDKVWVGVLGFFPPETLLPPASQRQHSENPICWEDLQMGWVLF